MAKKGFSYYNVDTDRYQDIRIKRLKKDHGCNGVAVYDYILCEIYRVRGCVLEWDESTAFDVAEYFGLKESQVVEIVNYCCAVGLFNKELLTNGRVLTSESIQRRYMDMCKRSKRSDCEIPEFWLIPPEKTGKTPEETPQTPEEFDKEKKSRVNNPPIVPPGDERSTGRFVKPTVEQVEDYCRKRSNNIAGADFVDFYESKGWKVGTSPMKDWRAAVRTWEHKRKSEKHSESTPKPLKLLM